MARRALVLFLVFHLFAVHAARGDAAGLSLSLKPEKESYGLEEARSGNVTLTATFTNAGEGVLFLAHPSATAPDSYTGEGSFGFDERCGKSEMLLYIKGPGGEETVLRHNVLRGFEPGNVFRLDIPPGDTREIMLGWLGPYFALGMWDDIREPIFTERGEYKIRMVYRNYFGKALSFGRGTDIFEKDVPWTGEVVSNTISVRVE